MTHITNLAVTYGLTQSQITTIISAVKALPKPDRWATSQFPCGCCGQVTVVVSAHSEGDHVPEFEFVCEDGRVTLDVHGASGENYACEVWSVAAALRIMRFAVADADMADTSGMVNSRCATRRRKDGGLTCEAV